MCYVIGLSCFPHCSPFLPLSSPPTSLAPQQAPSSPTFISSFGVWLTGFGFAYSFLPECGRRVMCRTKFNVSVVCHRRKWQLCHQITLTCVYQCSWRMLLYCFSAFIYLFIFWLGLSLTFMVIVLSQNECGSIPSFPPSRCSLESVAIRSSLHLEKSTSYVVWS